MAKDDFSEYVSNGDFLSERLNHVQDGSQTIGEGCVLIPPPVAPQTPVTDNKKK